MSKTAAFVLGSLSVTDLRRTPKFGDGVAAQRWPRSARPAGQLPPISLDTRGGLEDEAHAAPSASLAAAALRSLSIRLIFARVNRPLRHG